MRRDSDVAVSAIDCISFFSDLCACEEKICPYHLAVSFYLGTPRHFIIFLLSSSNKKPMCQAGVEYIDKDSVSLEQTLWAGSHTRTMFSQVVVYILGKFRRPNVSAQRNMNSRSLMTDYNFHPQILQVTKAYFIKPNSSNMAPRYNTDSALVVAKSAPCNKASHVNRMYTWPKPSHTRAVFCRFQDDKITQCFCATLIYLFTSTLIYFSVRSCNCQASYIR